MHFKIHDLDNTKVAELISDEQIINSLDNALDVMGNASYLGAYAVLVKKEQITPEFFDLKTGVAGEILQKFSTYNMQLGIMGDFSKINSQSLRDFIYESNKMGRIVFGSTMKDILNLLKIKY